MSTLVSERGRLKAALTRFKRYFTEPRDSCSIASLQKHLESHASLLDSFRKLQDRIDSLVKGTDAAATHETGRETFGTAYFDFMTSVEGYIRDSRPPSMPELPANPLSSPYMSSANIDTRLPIIQLPSFDGNFNDWIRFRDTFLSLIHNNPSISDLQRFHYLNSALKGSAARVVKSLGISGTNYRIAWDSLKARYEDPMALRRYHMNAFLNL